MILFFIIINIIITIIIIIIIIIFVNNKFNLKDDALGNVEIDSFIEKPLKLLGSEVCGLNTPSAKFARLNRSKKT